MNAKEIGEKGKWLNLSVASRAMNTPADSDQIKQYDEIKPGGTVNYGIVAGILFLGMGYLAARLFLSNHWVWGALTVLPILFLCFLTYAHLSVGLRKEVAYEDGLLVSALIINTNPIELIVLADVRSDDDLSPRVLGIQRRCGDRQGH